MLDALVVNASPLIFLGNAGRLELIRSIDAKRYIVPKRVYEEVCGSRHLDSAVKALKEASWIEPASAVSIPSTIVGWDLGLGESEVIALALEISGSRTVIDDLNGRKCALSHGLEVMGTLGVVVSSFRRGVIKDPREVLMELRRAGMWLSDAVISKSLQAAGIEPTR